MVEDDQKVVLNLGCGETRKIGAINVDLYGEPDFRWDLNETPYPWEDNYADRVEMYHVLEHIPEWWEAFKECARVLKPGGILEIRVPDESSSTALSYRDHYNVFTWHSFHGIQRAEHATNSWAKTIKDSVPLNMIEHYRVPFKEYSWMTRFPRLLEFCAKHMRNFIWEQRFVFRKIGG